MVHVRHLLAGLFLLAFAFAATAAAPAHEVGLKKLSAHPSARQSAIDISVFYPARDDGRAETYGASAIFEGVAVRRDASVAKGGFPVVLLALGGLRANPAISGWLANYLAARGNIVVVPHPPRLTDAHAAVAEVWLRPSDLSSALDTIEADTAFAPHLSPGNIAAVGFFMGGTSTLMLSGARIDSESYRSSCDDVDAGPDCTWFAKSGVDLRKTDAAAVSASRLDPRIGAAIIADPELSANFSAASLKAIDIPVHVIALGASFSNPSRLSGLIPNASYATVPEATQFSAFPRCTPKAEAILREEGEEVAICRDGGTRSREEIHAEIGQIVDRALATAFEKDR